MSRPLGFILTGMIKISDFLAPKFNFVKTLVFFSTFAIFVLFGMIPAMERILNSRTQHSHPLIWYLNFFFLLSSYTCRIFDFLTNPPAFGRLWICVYWISLLTIAIPLGSYLTISYSKVIPQIVARKFFHFLSCVMFAPIIEYDVEFMSLAFAVAICGLLCVEYIR
jgi:hypothetical protein